MTLRTVLTIAFLVVLMAVVACAPAPAAGGPPEITVSDAWSRPSPMVAGNGAVYMKLTNTGGEDDRLVGAASDAAGAVELHETKMEGDMMKMSPVHDIVIPAGGSAELKPGGLHVMLIGLKNELVMGREVFITLNFEKSDPITVKAIIKEMDGGDMSNMSSGNDG